MEPCIPAHLVPCQLRKWFEEGLLTSTQWAHLIIDAYPHKDLDKEEANEGLHEAMDEEEDTLEKDGSEEDGGATGNVIKLTWDEGSDSNSTDWWPMARVHRTTIKLLQQAISKSYVEKKRLGAFLKGKMMVAVCMQLGDLEQIVQDHGSIATALVTAIASGITMPEDMQHLQSQLDTFGWHNAFQWSHLRLNLPGPKGYTPSQAWLLKRRKDDSLASDFVCFVDDQRVTASTSERIIEAGHTISTKESYPGLQDASHIGPQVTLVAANVLPALSGVFVTLDVSVPWRGLDDWCNLLSWPSDWVTVTILGSGYPTFVHTILTKVKAHHDGILIFASNVVARGKKARDVMGLLARAVALMTNHGLASRIVSHAGFGVATSAAHIVGVRGISMDALTPSNPLTRTLSHVISPTANIFSQEIEALLPLDDPSRTPIQYRENLLHPNGLWDVTSPDIHIGCCSVFKRMGWIRRHLTPSEFLCACYMPLGMDVLLAGDTRAPDILVWEISPLNVTSIVCSMLAGGSGGGLFGRECRTFRGDNILANGCRGKEWNSGKDSSSRERCFEMQD